ncbi:MAG: acyl carrier protein [Acidimicrobiales bacterium]
MGKQVGQVFADHARLRVPMGDVADDGNLCMAGMTSHTVVVLDDTFGVEFPEAMLRTSTSESVSSIEATLSELDMVFMSRPS